ncbi:PREDICTED: phospholipid phosphatase 5-like [Amphimedon queenslandica]|uniref:Phosphatidic acid phosphatase type 2/haloperoxidase domain-containing protein n=1 Tax=Amphimedon queenslandica TaxID=400682 RepID=A0A1X7VKY7_AMPQE|nr:PREDICTED: phospholipid phosphatase 5-like [Amphimedon queenslandica]|eukprot:XP_003383907.2 PREDICTED: phospholipid phosphatase 5-like [Amphimedon queenslandica]
MKLFSVFLSPSLSLRNCMYLTRSLRLNCGIMKSFLVQEIIVRLALLLVFCYLETLESFHRSIPQEELWRYKYPHHGSTVSTPTLFFVSVCLPAAFILACYIIYRDTTDLIQGTLGLALTMVLNGVILNVIKLTVGRPRPDFFYRCFLHGEATPDLQCNGDPLLISEGRKSFPSGHSGWMFAGFGYLSLYLAGKLHCFTLEGRSQSWRLITVLTPLISAAVVGISRIQDNMHHWEDVAVGSLLGFLMAFICYRHHFPSIFDTSSSYPYHYQRIDSISLPINSSSSTNLPTGMLTPNRSSHQMPLISSKLQLSEEKTL